MKRIQPVAAIILAAGLVAPSLSTVTATASPRHNHRFVAGTFTTPLPGAVAVSPTSGSSTKDEPINLLAGSPGGVVFDRSRSSDSDDPLSEPVHLYEVNSAGDVTALGVQPHGEEWSLTATMLTSIPFLRSTTVRWLDTSDDSSGTGSIPDGAAYLGATSNGWAYVVNNQVFTKTTSGTTTSLGFPLGNGAGVNVTSGGTGPNGLIAADGSGAMAYVPYANPTHPVALDTAVSRSASDDPLYFSCQVRTADAVCGAATNGFPPIFFIDDGERLSLTGGSAVRIPPPSGDNEYQQVAIDGHTTALSSSDDYVVTNPGGTGVSTTHVTQPIQLVSAFNKIVRTNTAGNDIETFDAPDDTPSVLVAPKLAPIEVTGSSLTTGRIVYADDAATPSASPQPHVWSRPIRSDGGAVKLGELRYVGLMDKVSDEDRGFQAPVASDALTAYLGALRFNHPAYRFARPVEPRTWFSGRGDSIDVVSGDRVMDPGRAIVDTTAKKLQRSKPLGHRPVEAALWGDSYCYMSHAGRIGCVGLASGRRQTVRHSVSTDTTKTPAYGDLWVYGNHLAWLDGQHSPQPVVTEIRHPSQRLRLPASMRIVSLSNVGMLLAKPASLTTHHDVTYFVRGYARDATPFEVLHESHPEFNPDAGISVEHSILTWIDHGVVMAAALPHAPDRPRFLGAPVAPTRMQAGATDAWQAYLPYSASLSQCAVTIRRGNSVLRTLQCDPADMRYGSVVVSWDGRDKAGATAPAGKVTWTVHASNADGRARAAGGSKHPVDGTITVTQ